MSRTVRRDFPQKYYNKESADARRETRRMERHRAGAHIKAERYDEAAARQVKNTEGWNTH